MAELASKLYELAAEFREIAEKLQDSDMPEDVVRDTLESCAMDFENKAISTASLIRNLETTAEAIKAAETEQAKRRKAVEKRIDWLRDYLLNCMTSVDRQRIDCPLFKIAIQSNPVSVIIDGEVPEDYLVYPEPPAPHPDKAAIKAALESGREVTGARLFSNKRLVIK